MATVASKAMQSGCRKVSRCNLPVCTRSGPYPARLFCNHTLERKNSVPLLGNSSRSFHGPARALFQKEEELRANDEEFSKILFGLKSSNPGTARAHQNLAHKRQVNEEEPDADIELDLDSIEKQIQEKTKNEAKFNAVLSVLQHSGTRMAVSVNNSGGETSAFNSLLRGLKEEAEEAEIEAFMDGHWLANRGPQSVIITNDSENNDGTHRSLHSGDENFTEMLESMRLNSQLEELEELEEQSQLNLADQKRRDIQFNRATLTEDHFRELLSTMSLNNDIEDLEEEVYTPDEVAPKQRFLNAADASFSQLLRTLRINFEYEHHAQLP